MVLTVSANLKELYTMKYPFSIKQRIRSFRYAFNGLKVLLQEEHNAWIHLAVTALVIIAGFILKISATEWLAIILVIALVVALELINTALENLCDFVHPDKHDGIKKIKDLSAAAVLIAAIAAATIGLIVFVPKIVGCF